MTRLIGSSLPPGVVYAPPGWASNAIGNDDTAALNTALNAARAIATLGNSVGTLILDNATYFLSGPLNCFNVRLLGWGPGGTRLTLKSDWCSAVPCNAGHALDQQPSVALPSPTQNAASQASGSTAYTNGQVVSAWVTAANSRNGGETPVSGMQQIAISSNGNQPTVNWSAIANIDSTTTFNIYLDRSGGTNPANAIKVKSGATGTSWTDTTGTGGSSHPPTVNTTGGVGIIAPDFSRVGPSPNFQPSIEGVQVLGTGTMTRGTVPAHVSAIRQGANGIVRNVTTTGVFAGIYQNLDHEKIYASSLSGYYAIYRGGPAGDSGDQVFEDLELTGTWAGFGVGLGAQFGGAHFRKVHIAAAPFGVYKESIDASTTNSGVVIAGCHLSQVAFESIGNGNIFCAGAVNAAVSGNVLSNVQSTNGLDPGVNIATSTTDYQGVAIGRQNAAIDLNGGSWGGNVVIGGDPSLLHPSATYVVGIAANVQQSGDYDATGLINRLQTDNKPFTSAPPPNADSIIRWNGCLCRLYYANGAIGKGDLVQAGGGGQPGVAKSTGSAKPVGVALLAASTGQAVLIAHSGVVYINSSTNTIAANATLTQDGTNNGAVAAGTPSASNVVGTAMQANSGGQVRALLQGLL